MRKTLMLLATLFVATTALASDEMKKLDFLIGEWKGEAMIQMGPGKPNYAVQTETVVPKLGGKALLIEGMGFRKKDDGTLGEVVHDALAIITWDEKKNTYRFSAYTAQYGSLETTIDVSAGPTAVWAMDVPGGKT